MAASDHPLAHKKEITQATVLREPFVVHEKGSDTWKSMEESFGCHLSYVKIGMDIKSTETIKQAVLAGMASVFFSHSPLAGRFRRVVWRCSTCAVSR